jgi:RNA recognition motif-containing protein
MFSNKTFN